MQVEIPAEITSLLAVWDTNAIKYMYAGYILVAVGIVSGLAVTAFADKLGTTWVRVLGFVAALCTTVLASFNPIEAGNDFREAWRVLNEASLTYKLNEKDRDPANLVAAVKEGESIISRIPLAKISDAGVKQKDKPANESQK